jgi:predicted RNase H-like HicB family nuclease
MAGSLLAIHAEQQPEEPYRFRSFTPSRRAVTLLPMRFTVEIDREEDGRWIAEVPDLPGVMVYGSTREEAMARAKALALRVLAELSLV